MQFVRAKNNDKIQYCETWARASHITKLTHRWQAPDIPSDVYVYMRSDGNIRDINNIQVEKSRENVKAYCLMSLDDFKHVKEDSSAQPGWDWGEFSEDEARPGPGPDP